MTSNPDDSHLVMNEVATRLREIYGHVRRLEELFPGRSFTPDGHMVGSIGEAWAQWLYGVSLLPPSTERHDATCADGRLVQIKATQGKSVAMYGEPAHLIVLQLGENGLPTEIYNGPGSTPWSKAGSIQKNGQRSIRLTTLKTLMKDVEPSCRLSLVRSIAELSKSTS